MGTIDKLKELRNPEKTFIGKPCPICGSAPKICEEEYDPWGDGAGTVTAYSCVCGSCGMIQGGSFDSSSYLDNEEAKGKAIKDWNDVVDFFNYIIDQEALKRYLNG